MDTKELKTQCDDCPSPNIFTSTVCEFCWQRKCIKQNVKYFLMSRYVVCSGDKYRLNKDDHKRIDEILDGRELRDDENPYKA